MALLAFMFAAPIAKASPFRHSKRRKPKRLPEGATIGLIAPASPVSEEKIEKALSNLSALGFRVKEGASLRARLGYLAAAEVLFGAEDRLWTALEAKRSQGFTTESGGPLGAEASLGRFMQALSPYFPPE